jgi:predicted dehydrogenase
MEKIIKFAVVGCGNIGTRHLAVLDAQPRAKIVALCDIEAFKCEKYSVLYGNVPYFTDYSELLAKTAPDVINICTPHSLHAPMAIAAARAHRHVLVEKPMALTTFECEAMVAEAERAGTRLMVVKQNRYNIPIVLTNQALKDKKLGRIFMVQCNVLWNRLDSYYRDSPWRGWKRSEGGALYTQVSHFLDLMIWWFGDVLEAQSSIATKNHNIEIDDCGESILRFSTGVMGALNWTTCVYNKNYEGSITIIGEKGLIRIGGEYLNRIEKWDVEACPLDADIGYVDKPNAYGNYQGTSSNHDKVISDVVADLLQGHHNTVDGQAGLKTVHAIELIYRACAERESQHIHAFRSR